jgi:hypothetical protein
MEIVATHVTAVTLTIEAGQHGKLWRLRWTQERDGRNAGNWTKTHDTEHAARRHATGLCAKRPPGTAIADIFTDDRGS